MEVYASYRIYSVIRPAFSLPNQSEKFRSIVKDGSRFFRLFGKVGLFRFNSSLRQYFSLFQFWKGKFQLYLNYSRLISTFEASLEGESSIL